MSQGAESKSPAASSQKPRAQIVNMDICSKSRSTRQWAKMGFLHFSPFLIRQSRQMGRMGYCPFAGTTV